MSFQTAFPNGAPLTDDLSDVTGSPSPPVAAMLCLAEPDQGKRSMRHASLLAASVVAIGALAACNEQPSAPAPDPAASAAAAETAVAEARAADLAAATAVHSGGPGVYFVNLKNGDTVTSPFRVVFGVHGMGVAPALIEKENTGHHHLLIDTELSEEEKEFAIPNDGQHLHFGGGQTETVIAGLPAGQHTLQLVFGDLNHELHETPMMSEKITITVK